MKRENDEIHDELIRQFIRRGRKADERPLSPCTRRRVMQSLPSCRSHRWVWAASILLVACMAIGGNLHFLEKMTPSRHVAALTPHTVVPWPSGISHARWKDMLARYDSHPQADSLLRDSLFRLCALYKEVYGWGCSWYCGGEVEAVEATSVRDSMLGSTYLPTQAADSRLSTAWVEGAEGDGIGERLTFTFSPHSWPVSEIKIVNGYAKNEKVWRANSRIRKLKVLHNGQWVYTLQLADIRDLQVFLLPDTLGTPSGKAPWTLSFEILEVYPGSKFSDTAITEILFGPELAH